jgi:hypothetical protein
LNIVLAPLIAEGFGKLSEGTLCSGIGRDSEAALKGK